VSIQQEHVEPSDKRILIADDEDGLRTMIAEILTAQGYEVLEASNGEEAVSIAQRAHPSLIICDIQMPVLSGFETLERLRKDPGTASIPFVFLTGQADRQQMRVGMELGADDYITKPVSAGELLSAVRTRLEKLALLQSQTDEKLRELRASISLALPHELRTPLNAILGFAEIIGSDASSLPTEQISEMAGMIHASAKRLHRVLENFLLYAQVEILSSDVAKLSQMRKQWTDDAQVLLQVASEQAADQAARKDDLRLDLLPAAAAIGSQDLTKIIFEILDNAFKFSPSGSAVEVSARPEGPSYVVRVTDHGRGITAEQIARIGAYVQFERRLQEQQGTGLGLSIAKRLAELYGGNIELQSEPGRSTSVTISIPLSHPAHKS
jgi:two-component system sensor histidine kinase/response regulator